MKTERVLVTGGAGFIGSFLVDELVEKGCRVRILDSLEKQVHDGKRPRYLNKEAEFIEGDVRNYPTFKKALNNIDAVFHLASAVGVGQSNYLIKKYMSVNALGTANLLDIIANHKHSIRKIILPSSMTGFGEGNYYCGSCKIVRPPLREESQLLEKKWNLFCPCCHKEVTPVPTPEQAEEFPNSIYAIGKKAQQDMLLMIGKMYGVPSVALRFFNIYGPRQSLSNPYTGVTAIFISRLKNDQPAVVYEDGLQTRDFVSVHDAVNALVLSLENESANYQVVNIGSGKPTPIKEIAEILAELMGKKGLVSVNQEFRKNDIRHCFADISKAKRLLGWEPKVSLQEGLKELIEWSANEDAKDDFKLAEKQLKQKGLL